jgi:guanidinopropionase
MRDLRQDDWAHELGFRVITTVECVDRGVEAIIKEARSIIGDGPAYLSFDVDAIDPAYAPGVADLEPDGLTVREIRQFIKGFRGIELMGADIVCYCSPLDNPSEITALTICLFMHDAISLMADYSQGEMKPDYY